MTDSAYHIQSHISWEEAVSRGMELREAKDNSQWDLGDLALEVDAVYGQDSIGKFSNEILINKKSLQQYRRVASAFPPNKRSKYLSHRHHMILAPRKDRFEWLERAHDGNLTVSQLERALVVADGGTPNLTAELPNVVQCETCHNYRIESDKICHCYQYGGHHE